MKRNQFKKLSAFIFIITILSANFSTFGQIKKTSAVAANNPKKSAPKCSGAWTGNITYSRTQTITDNKTVKRVSMRGEGKSNFEMRYNYKASVAVLEAPEKNGSYIGKARIEHNLTSDETSVAQEENSCDRGKTFQVMSGQFTNKSETSANASNVEASVSVGVNDDGTYSVSVGVPQIQGKVTGSQTSSFSGQCTKKEGKSLTLPPTFTTVDGHSITSDGTTRVDPKDPNNLSGSYSLNLPGNASETISWSLQKCGAPLRITDIEFEDMKFPNWNDWQEITEQKGTIDGNFVKIKAKILNESGETKYADVRFKETYKGDKWNGAKPDAPLKDDVASVRVEANSEETVELLWDSSGYAWFDDGRPRLLQRIKAELEENGKKIDEKTENLKIAPKPVVLVHGLWSNWHAFETWQNILTTTHSYDWKAFPVGEKPEHGVMNTGKSFMSPEQTASIGDNAHGVESYVKYAQEDRNAWHVDIVAHSIGGLISRWYIDQLMNNYSEDPRPRVSHLVMLGTPNMGSPCADVMDIAFGMIGKQVEAVRQMQPDYVEGFNKVHTQRKGVKFSSLAGNPSPMMCKNLVPNDGVVSVASAKWIIKDTAESSSFHNDLTGTKDFSGFVKPRLAIGPKGNHDPDVDIPRTTAQIFQPDSDVYALNTSHGPNASSVEFNNYSIENSFDKNYYKPDFAKDIKISPMQSIEIEIPVQTAQNFGITFMADPHISATLYNEKGEIAGKNLTKTPEANAWFRSIYVGKNVSGGTWKLKLENTFDKELEAIVASWSNAVQK